jgi:hypothetical protein
MMSFIRGDRRAGGAPIRGGAPLRAGGVAAAVVVTFGVSRQTAHHWYQTWKQEDRDGLAAAGRLGRRPRPDHQQRARVDTALRDGPRAHGFKTDLWTCCASPSSSSGSRGSGITRGMHRHPVKGRRLGVCPRSYRSPGDLISGAGRPTHQVPLGQLSVAGGAT